MARYRLQCVGTFPTARTRIGVYQSSQSLIDENYSCA